MGGSVLPQAPGECDPAGRGRRPAAGRGHRQRGTWSRAGGGYPGQGSCREMQRIADQSV